MKKIIFFLFVLISIKGMGQYKVPQTLGSDSTLVTSKGALKGRIINWTYTDTTQANTQHIKLYPGAQIFTSSDDLFWYRNATATKWINPSDTASTGSVTVVSYTKNATRDSSILLLSDGTRYAVKDTAGVTNIATGYGLSGGPITTTGTIIADTATLSTKYLRIVDTTNKWVTSVYRKTASDTVFYVKNGVSTFAFKDSIGTGAGVVTVTSFTKNFTRDSSILLLSDLTRFAVKDSIGIPFDPTNPYDPITDTIDYIAEFVIVPDLLDSGKLKRMFYRQPIYVDTAYATTDTTLHFKRGIIEWDVLFTRDSSLFVSSFVKNATRDSIILTLSNGTRYAVRDSIGTGGGGGSQTLQQVFDVENQRAILTATNDTIDVANNNLLVYGQGGGIYNALIYNTGNTAGGFFTVTGNTTTLGSSTTFRATSITTDSTKLILSAAAPPAGHTTQLFLYGDSMVLRNATGQNLFRVLQLTGQTQLSKYGAGTFTGTPTYDLSVDANGNIIETTVGGGSVPGIDQVLSVNQALTADQSIDENGFNLNLFNGTTTINSLFLSGTPSGASTDSIVTVNTTTGEVRVRDAAGFGGGGGGGTTDYQIQTASGSTSFTFSGLPASMTDYLIFRNGVKIRQTTDYTASGTTVTIPAIVSGDSVEYQRIK